MLSKEKKKKKKFIEIIGLFRSSSMVQTLKKLLNLLIFSLPKVLFREAVNFTKISVKLEVFLSYQKKKKKRKFIEIKMENKHSISINF